eukprot:364080-Chlamydomonas_euryale.AAC.4
MPCALDAGAVLSLQAQLGLASSGCEQHLCLQLRQKRVCQARRGPVLSPGQLTSRTGELEAGCRCPADAELPAVRRQHLHRPKRADMPRHLLCRLAARCAPH